EALVNYLALLGWAPPGGTREIFSREGLIKEFSLERVTPSPAVFDMEKLYWLNRHYIKEGARRIEKLAFGYFLQALSGITESPDVVRWFGSITGLLVPSVDRLDQLPERASLIFNYDAKAALAAPDNAEVLGWPNTDAVLNHFTIKILEDEHAREGKLSP